MRGQWREKEMEGDEGEDGCENTFILAWKRRGKKKRRSKKGEDDKERVGQNTLGMQQKQNEWRVKKKEKGGRKGAGEEKTAKTENERLSI